MLFNFWATVEEGGPTLKQYRVNVLCLWEFLKIVIYNSTVVIGADPACVCVCGGGGACD